MLDDSTLKPKRRPIPSKTVNQQRLNAVAYNNPELTPIGQAFAKTMKRSIDPDPSPINTSSISQGPVDEEENLSSAAEDSGYSDADDMGNLSSWEDEGADKEDEV